MEMEIRKFSDLSSVRESTEEKRVSVSCIIHIETFYFTVFCGKSFLICIYYLVVLLVNPDCML